MKILICESDEILLTAIEFRLSKQGFDVELSKLEGNIGEELSSVSPDLVIVDMDMENPAGMEVVKEVKGWRGDHTSVLLLADPDEEERIMNAYAAGISDFISKPFKPAELLIRVRRILQVD